MSRWAPNLGRVLWSLRLAHVGLGLGPLVAGPVRHNGPSVRRLRPLPWLLLSPSLGDGADDLGF